MKSLTLYRYLAVTLLFIATAAMGHSASAEGWGHLEGRFTLSGAAESEEIVVTQDVAFCGKFGLHDESLVVGAQGGLANVVIFLYPDKDAGPPEPHASYAESAAAEVVLDNKQCRFQPHILLVRTSQKFKAVNSDTVAHNTKIDYDPDPINPSIPPGQAVKHAFPEEQRLPVTVSCSSHPWMRALLVVRESPYMAVTDKDGQFEIKNLPAGKWTFQFWHESLGFVRKVEVDGQPTDWSRGRHEVAIAADQTTDLGEVKLKMADYE